MLHRTKQTRRGFRYVGSDNLDLAKGYASKCGLLDPLTTRLSKEMSIH